MTPRDTPPPSPADLAHDYSERAAIGEYERGMTRAESERQAALLVYGAEQLTLTSEPQQPRSAARSKRR